MDWSSQQVVALEAISSWYHDSEDQVFFLAGYAGTGKTTLARTIVDQLGAGKVCIGAYTGKAAQVLRRKGFPGATTIHGMIYIPTGRNRMKLEEIARELAVQNDPDKTPVKDERKVRLLERQLKNEHEKLGQPAFTLDTESDVREADLIVIDECSMIDERIGEDLLSFGVKVLVIGDPGQLPPIKGAGYFTSNEPDCMLEEIHRQAADNPIIDMATKVRDGETLPLGRYGHSRILRKSSLNNEAEYALLKAADQVLVGYHTTRMRINNMMRRKAGRVNQLPMKDDKLVCLRNDHDIGILNGSLWRVMTSKPIDQETCLLHIQAEDEDRNIDVVAYNKIFMGDKIEWDQRIGGVQDFDYGYALTVHKAQGSQWQKVVLYDEWNYREREKWLYTALTRAEVKIDVLR